MSESKIYALAHLIHEDTAFAPGDELQQHLAPEQLEALIARGEARRSRRQGIKPRLRAHRAQL